MNLSVCHSLSEFLRNREAIASHVTGSQPITFRSAKDKQVAFASEQQVRMVECYLRYFHSNQKDNFESLDR